MVWLDKTDIRRESAETTLAQSYREAWDSGDALERYLALQFVLLRQEKAGFDIVVEGLRSHDSRLASAAEAAAFSLVVQGHDLGYGIRGALQEFMTRFPEWSDVTQALVRRLDA